MKIFFFFWNFFFKLFLEIFFWNFLAFSARYIRACMGVALCMRTDLYPRWFVSTHQWKIDRFQRNLSFFTGFVVVDVDKNNDSLWPVTHRIFAYRFRICARLNGPDGQHAVLVLCFFSLGNNVVMLFLLLILLLLML